MKNAFDVAENVISLINVPAVTDHISGKTWAFDRPGNRDLVDIVVGVLMISNDYLQRGVANIRIHAPDVAISAVKQTDWRTDLKTLDRVAKLIIPLVDNQYKHSFFTHIDRHGPSRTLDGQGMYVIRLDYYSFQENYKNI